MQTNVTWLAGLVLAAALSPLGGCATDGPHDRFGPAEGLDLDRVVLYRNGVGYFERRGTVEGDRLQIRCRKDQVNDILKSLTVVDRNSGQAVSVSMPLDPQSWANAALTTLKPGQGSLGEVLDALRGTWVTLRTSTKAVSGRILLVETIEKENGLDQQISVLDGDAVEVVLLSQVNRVRFQDGELALQLNRSLDVTAGEGIFQQVTVDVRLAGAKEHKLLLSYVVAAPIWKPTYRIVLPDDGDKALLQGWAVVDNISGEDWTNVKMSLTSGAPIAFRFDLHTPRNVGRPDMSSLGWSRRARVAQGESALPSPDPEPSAGAAALDDTVAERESRRARSAPKKRDANKAYGRGGGGGGGFPAEEQPNDPSFDLGDSDGDDTGIVLDELARSTNVQTRAATVSGLTRYDLGRRVTVPDGTSTMVAILNETVTAEQTFLYRPGGGGPGFEQNPYRVVRFKNSTPFVLETGPISIYAGGSFVGEGIARTIAADASTTIPFSVEHEIAVTSTVDNNAGSARLVRMVGGVLTVESWQRHVTTWKIRAPKQDQKRKILVRHSRYGNTYELEKRPDGAEDVPDAYLLPVWVAAGKTEGTLEVVERTPSRRSVSIWDNTANDVLTALVAADNVDAALLAKLRPIIEKRKEIADIDRRVANLKTRQRELDERADQTRRNLEAIKKDPAAGKLRGRLNKRLDDFTKEGDGIGREVVELTSKRLERKIEIDELIEGLSIEIKP